MAMLIPKEITDNDAVHCIMQTACKLDGNTLVDELSWSRTSQLQLHLAVTNGIRVTPMHLRHLKAQIQCYQEQAI